MPRIPLRTQPYSSPSRQQRHFKLKRDQILRALGKASYINGSHFAILWVNSRGETETYASDVFKNKLPHWFNPAVLDDATKAALAPRPSKASEDQENTSPEMLDDDDSLTWTESEQRPGSRHSTHSHIHTPLITQALPDIAELPLDQLVPQQKFLTQNAPPPEYKRSNSAPNPLTLNNTAQSNCFPHQPQSFSRNNHNYPRPRPLNLSRSNSRSALGPDAAMMTPSSAEYKPLVIGDTDEVSVFLETRFRQLQQLCCKIVAKAWIKVIEPKKQTRYPYNRGEASKPEWWPTDVRHKEPDHLMKPGMLIPPNSNDRTDHIVNDSFTVWTCPN
jgi:hypothetical protein